MKDLSKIAGKNDDAWKKNGSFVTYVLRSVVASGRKGWF